MTNLDNSFKDWYQLKEELILSLIKSADLLDQRHVKICISRIIGNSVSSIGGGMFVAGIALAPFSAGTSLPLFAVVGSIIGFLGNATSIGSVVYEKIAERKDLNDVKKLIEKFNHNTETLLSQQANLYWNFINFITPSLAAYGAVNVCIKFFQFLDSIGDTTEITGALFTNSVVASGMSGRILGKYALHASLGLNLIGIVADTVDTSFAARDIVKHKKGTHDENSIPSKKLREFIIKFQKLRFDEIENRFIKYNGGISIINKAHYSARVKIFYKLENKKIYVFESDSFRRRYTCTKEFLIPKEAKEPVLKIQMLFLGFNCNFNGNVWRTIFRENIQIPYFKVFKLSGSIFFPDVNEINFKLHN